jgi:hypothetical protein
MWHSSDLPQYAIDRPIGGSKTQAAGGAVEVRVDVRVDVAGVS